LTLNQSFRSGLDPLVSIRADTVLAYQAEKQIAIREFFRVLEIFRRYNRIIESGDRYISKIFLKFLEKKGLLTRRDDESILENSR